jgi:DNA (cytosine-5)-methyltransferase 1
LESEDYACGAVGMPAAGVGAPHIRQRLWFVAQSSEVGRGGRRDGDTPRHSGQVQTEGRGSPSELANDIDARPQGWVSGGAHEGRENQHGHVGRNGTTGFWAAADWLPCRDGKARPVEPGTFPLAYGSTARVGRLRAYGNAIVPQVAQALIEVYLSCN